jgi:hypothetical protein
VIDFKIGKTIIEGKTVTGFTIEGELIFRILDKLREDKVVPVVEAVTAVGAYYSSSMNALDDYSITSGRVVTGTNPQSARSACERVVKLSTTCECFRNFGDPNMTAVVKLFDKGTEQVNSSVHLQQKYKEQPL